MSCLLGRTGFWSLQLLFVLDDKLRVTPSLSFSSIFLLLGARNCLTYLTTWWPALLTCSSSSHIPRQPTTAPSNGQRRLQSPFQRTLPHARRQSNKLIPLNSTCPPPPPRSDPRVTLSGPRSAQLEQTAVNARDKCPNRSEARPRDAV